MNFKYSILLFTVLTFLAGCTSVTAVSADSPAVSGQLITIDQDDILAGSEVVVEYNEEDLVSSENNAEISIIRLEGSFISFEGSGALVEGSLVTIHEEGTYYLSGSLFDGQILVDAGDDDQVFLILDGVDISSSRSAPIYVVNAEKVVISLAAGSENVVSDGESYIFDEQSSDEPDAAIFSHDDLTINGTGALIVNASYKNGITSKDDLKITGGVITINALNDGLKGRDSVAILSGRITIQAGGDGIQANNDQDVEKGWVAIEDGSLLIIAGSDGIQAETDLAVSGGEIEVVSGEGSSGRTDESAKGLKAGDYLLLSGGVIHVNAADDALHSDKSLVIDQGEILLASGDDAIHGDELVILNDGKIEITESYEGIEGAAILINGGTIHVVSSDDGINVSSGGGREGMSFSESNYLEINGGRVVIHSGGDGLDSNGSGVMNGGTVIVYGPVQNNNGALDVNGMLVVNGGFLAAVGSSGMAQSPSSSSSQFSVLQLLPSTQRAGTLIHIISDDGVEILTLESPKEFQSIVISSADLEMGSTYSIFLGGTVEGTAVDGLYENGLYSPGSLAASFTISSMVTGENTGMMGGGGRGPGGGRGK